MTEVLMIMVALTLIATMGLGIVSCICSAIGLVLDIKTKLKERKRTDRRTNEPV